jgi:RNA polymerase sigma-70 factor (ECF subfamily)
MDMPSTMWTAILQIRDQPERVKDLVVRRYREPVYNFARQQGLSHEDAEDITQNVFLRMCEQSFLEKADRKKGRFRTFILAVTKHVIGTWQQYELAGKRDRRREIPIGDFDVPEEVIPDGAFDRLWVENLMQQAREHLKEDSMVRTVFLQSEGKSYEEIATLLGKKESDITNYIHRGKERLKREIVRLIGEYSTAEDVKDEITALRKFV